jgi:hypothetical protein
MVNSKFDLLFVSWPVDICGGQQHLRTIK